MKKTIIIPILVFLLLLTGCQSIRSSVLDRHRSDQTNTPKASPTQVATIAPTPSPTVSEPDEYSSWLLATYKSLEVQGGVLTMNIPTDLNQEYVTAGSLNIISGRLIDPEGETGICQVTVTHFFQAEDLPMDYESFDRMTEVNQFMNFGLDMEYERISETTVDDHATAFYTAYSFTRQGTYYDNFMFFVASDGVYYKISFIAPQGFVTTDDVWTMFKSVKIDEEKEAEWVNAFEVKADSEYYYSSRVEGAKMKHFSKLAPAESIRMVFEDIILNLTLSTSNGFVFVHRYEDSIFNITFDYESFINDMNESLVSRKMYDGSYIDAVERLYTNDGLLYLYYPIEYGATHEIMILQVLYMYEDAYYVAEVWYMGNDIDELTCLLDAAFSFTAPGENLTPVFEEHIE